MNREELVSKLQKGVVTVTFTKVDGSERVMKATLMPEVLPKVSGTTTPSTRRKNEEVLSVWDTEKAAWRSFKLANVIKVE